MKKILFVTLTAIFVMSMAGNAMAAGWWRENAVDTINTLAGNGAQDFNGYWANVSGDPTATSPHGQFSATTNKCKTCHAVHGALSTSFRLLRNNDRQDECNYCHWKASGASKYRLYAYDDLGATVRGEHTLGSTELPDSGLTASGVSADVSSGTVPDRGTYGAGGKPTLYCFSCHSVHGAGTLEGAANVGWWTQRILRTDPGMLGGGYSAANGLNSANVAKLGYSDYLSQDVQGGGSLDVTTVASTMTNAEKKNANRAAFCAGCHTRNFNWRKNMASGQDYSLQRGSHPLNTDGTLEVGGGAGVSGTIDVAWADANWCGSCHAAPIELGGTVNSDTDPATIPGAYAGGTGANQENTADALGIFDWGNETWYAAGFPHQSESDKLLFDDVRTASAIQTQDADITKGDINDAYRPLDSMDKICGKCHTNTLGWEAGTTAGPSKSF